jgi:hypothetical protein
MLTYADVCSGTGYELHTAEAAAAAMLCAKRAGQTYAHVCSRMLTYAGRMLTYADMLCAKRAGQTYAHVCSRMLTYADVC